MQSLAQALRSTAHRVSGAAFYYDDNKDMNQAASGSTTRWRRTQTLYFMHYKKAQIRRSGTERSHCLGAKGTTY